MQLRQRQPRIPQQQVCGIQVTLNDVSTAHNQWKAANIEPFLDPEIGNASRTNQQAPGDIDLDEPSSLQEPVEGSQPQPPEKSTASSTVPHAPATIKWSTRSVSRRLTRQQTLPEAQHGTDTNLTMPPADPKDVLGSFSNPPSINSVPSLHATPGTTEETKRGYTATPTATPPARASEVSPVTPPKAHPQKCDRDGLNTNGITDDCSAAGVSPPHARRGSRVVNKMEAHSSSVHQRLMTPPASQYQAAAATQQRRVATVLSVPKPYNHLVEWEEAESAAGDDSSFISCRLEAVAARLVALEVVHSVDSVPAAMMTATCSNGEGSTSSELLVTHPGSSNQWEASVQIPDRAPRSNPGATSEMVEHTAAGISAGQIVQKALEATAETSEVGIAHSGAVRGRIALQEVLTRMENRFKAEQAARQAAEKRLGETTDARIAIQSRIVAEAAANAKQAAALAQAQEAVSIQAQALQSVRAQLDICLAAARSEVSGACVTLQGLSGSRQEQSLTDCNFQQNGFVNSAAAAAAAAEIDLKRISSVVAAQLGSMDASVHRWRLQADESDKVRSEASARLATLAAYKAAMDSLADSLAASEPLQGGDVTTVNSLPNVRVPHLPQLRQQGGWGQQQAQQLHDSEVWIADDAETERQQQQLHQPPQQRQQQQQSAAAIQQPWSEEPQAWQCMDLCAARAPSVALPDERPAMPIIRRGARGINQGAQARRQMVARARDESPFNKAGKRFQATKPIKPKRNDSGSALGGKWS